MFGSRVITIGFGPSQARNVEPYWSMYLILSLILTVVKTILIISLITCITILEVTFMEDNVVQGRAENGQSHGSWQLQ